MKLEQSDKNFLFSETKLPDVFFTEYMSQANGDYIKVYLYIVFLSKYNKEVKINDVSKTLNIPFKTIQEAIAYWEEQEVLIKKNNGYIVVDLQEKELNKLYSPRLTSTPENALSNAKNQYRAKAIEDINNTCFQGMMSPSWYNDIDLWFNKYGFDANMRLHTRSKFGISDDIMVLGHVGRFMTQKNHIFLLEIFSEYVKLNKNSILMLVGGGELESKIKQKASELGIYEKIIFTGVRSDVPALLSAMDLFVFPSLYEGMPNTVIEAQATGLPCIVSNTITREADITGLVHYLPLGNAGEWANYFEQLPHVIRGTPIQKFKENCYDIESVTEQFVNLIFRE
mgnify:CR=1 FL=1